MEKLDVVCRRKIMAGNYLSHPVIIMEKSVPINLYQSLMFPNPIRLYKRVCPKQRMFQDIMLSLTLNLNTIIISLPKKTPKRYNPKQIFKTKTHERNPGANFMGSNQDHDQDLMDMSNENVLSHVFSVY
jgi:hypothetical protein